ncbi:type I restriction enzyme endonuclease domain-containing protein [Negadavirga shengliensis]|uniref:Type I restriction enzyme endonuclease domain-containing protein n=1 Tax=Negadavirga shengliensis TaxID=1389218 RepID=A0ABV9T7F5_9BACT
MTQELVKTLWVTADKLGNNMDAVEYKHVVLGLIFLKIEIKHILRKHGYPPDMQEKATETVLEQAKMMANMIDKEIKLYPDGNSDRDWGMAAED